MDKRTLDKAVEILKAGFLEDRYDDDITTRLLVADDLIATGNLIAKQDLIVSGIDIFKLGFCHDDQSATVDLFCKDGDFVKSGTVLGKVRGLARKILSRERVILNLLQHFSGISTKTREIVEKVKGYKAKILDTRKTTVYLRDLEKYAVRVGEGMNHRRDLSDMILIKENHICAAGSIKDAMLKARSGNVNNLLIEIEIRNLDELNEAIRYKPDRILLDNMSVEDTKLAVDIVDGKIAVESSGNIGIENVREYAATGVDYISLGSLTHSVRAADISLILELEQKRG